MKTLRLVREPSSDMATMGILTFGDTTLSTIERPWLPTDPGGKPFESCVPPGDYELIWHARANGDGVVALVNPGFGVYYQDDDRPNEVGRYLILIHAGNWVFDVVGCIAPGVGRTVTEKGPMVTNSRKAMSILMDWLGDDPAKILIRDEE